MAAMMAQLAGISTRHDTFSSIFPQPDFTTPTPETTPNIGVLASPGRPFGGFSLLQPDVDNAVRFSRAWSVATRYLTLDVDGHLQGQFPSIGPELCDAVAFVCQSTASQKQLCAWYVNEIGVHFRRHVLPQLAPWQFSISMADAAPIMDRTIALLEKAQAYYLDKLEMLRRRWPSHDRTPMSQTLFSQVKDRVHALYLNAIPQHRLRKTLAHVLYVQIKSSLVTYGNTEACLKRGQCQCKPTVGDALLRRLHNTGLGGTNGQQAFALAIHKLLEKHAVERRCFQVDWSGQSTVLPRLTQWIQDCLSPFVDASIRLLTDSEEACLAVADSDALARIAVTNFGRLRADALFDYVKQWPASTGAFVDIQQYLSHTLQDKAYVCDSFIRQTKRRLLHAGASTTEVLSIYANVIHGFRLLDARGVLLEKVAGPLRSYLRSRDDTVAIIAASFMADVDSEGNLVNVDAEKVCGDITVEVANSALVERREHRMLNFDDMDWVPDPIDAGPDFKASESEDVLAYVLGLFDQEDFIKEVTTVLAQHLLQATELEYVKETRLVELFKTRLDATKLQAAEVMLKDVRDSVSLNRRINPSRSDVIKLPPPREIQAAIPEEGMTLPGLYRMFEHRMKRGQFHAALTTVANKRGDLYFAKRTRLPPEPPTLAESEPPDQLEFKVQVLSSFFWPQMRANEFSLPPVFEQRKAEFERRFSELGNQRKLHFRDALGRVNVDLELEDRRVTENDVPAWRASVIDLFALIPPSEMTDAEMESEGLGVDYISGALQMEEELVVDALSFWVGKRVLLQTAPNVYAVLERLDMDVGVPQQQAQQHAEVSAVKSQDAVLRESAPMFETFIANMLRNGGPKEISGMMGITNMLKMVLPTFTYGEDEVRWLLEDMEGRGDVARSGEVWAAK